MVDDVDLAENAKSIPVGEVSQESVDCFLEGVLAYSRANEASLRRGQLLLFPEEAEKLNVVMRTFLLRTHIRVLLAAQSTRSLCLGIPRDS